MTASAQSSIEILRQVLNTLREALPRKRMLVLGDIGVDRYTRGKVERISPEAPVPIVWVQEEKHKLGLAANVAENIQVLGGEACLVGMLGEDRHAEDLRELLRRAEISDRYCIAHPRYRTIVKERVVSEQQQLLRIDYELPIEERPADINGAIAHVVTDLVPRCDAVVIEDYAKGFATGEVIAKTLEIAKSFGKPVYVDPNAKSHLEHYRGAQLLTPNRKEAEALSGEQDLRRAGQKILDVTQAQWVVVTLGKDGMAVFERGKAGFQHTPTFAREVFDVSGAGDTVISMMALALSAGASIESAVILGNVAAGVVVAKRGTATVSPQELQDALTGWGEHQEWHEFLPFNSASGLTTAAP